MRVQCEQCGSSYTLPEQRVAPGRRLQFQCRHCQHRIIVHIPTEAEPSAAPTASAPPPAARMLWFINAATGQQRMDSYGGRAAIAEGSVVADTWLWRKGMAEWAKAAEVADFAGLFGEPNPTRAMEPVGAAAAPVQAVSQLPPAAQAHSAGQGVVELARPAVLIGAHVAGAASVHKGAGFQTDQRAIPMPIIRVTQDGAEPISRDNARPRPATGSPLRQVEGNRASRPAPAQAETPSEVEASLRPESRAERRAAMGVRDTSRGEEGRTSAYAAMPDDDEPQRPERQGRGDRNSKGPWAPATDTYQGQRARNTRKVDDRDRQNAMEWAAAMERRDAEVQSLRDSLKAWQRLAFAGLIALVVVLLLTALVTVRMRDAADEAEACKAATGKRQGP